MSSNDDANGQRSQLIGFLSEEEYAKMVKMHEDERKKNVNEAIKLRQSKAKNSDFYYKLRNLTDNIHKYKVKFGEWHPDHIHQVPERENKETSNAVTAAQAKIQMSNKIKPKKNESPSRDQNEDVTIKGGSRKDLHQINEEDNLTKSKKKIHNSNFKRKIKSNHRNTPKLVKPNHQSHSSIKYNMKRKQSISISSYKSNEDALHQETPEQAKTSTGRIMDVATFHSDAMKTDGLNSVASPKVNEPNTCRVKQIPDRQRIKNINNSY